MTRCLVATRVSLSVPLSSLVLLSAWLDGSADAQHWHVSLEAFIQRLCLNQMRIPAHLRSAFCVLHSAFCIIFPLGPDQRALVCGWLLVVDPPATCNVMDYSWEILFNQARQIASALTRNQLPSKIGRFRAAARSNEGADAAEKENLEEWSWCNGSGT